MVDGAATFETAFGRAAFFFGATGKGRSRAFPNTISSSEIEMSEDESPEERRMRLTGNDDIIGPSKSS